VILFTGATGFIGHHLLQISPNSKSVSRNRNKKNTFCIDSLDATTNWEGAFTDINAVIHLAGLAHSHSFTEKEYQSVNLEGTLHLAHEAAKAGVKRFVFVSSIGVNGSSTLGVPFSIGSDPNPQNWYAESKYSAEAGLQKIAQETGLEVVIVRPPLVYGPNAPGNFGLLTRLVSYAPCLPFGLSNNKRDVIAVQNLADLLIKCAKHPDAAGHTFLVSDGKAVSIKAFTNAIAKGAGTSIIQLPIPVNLMRLVARICGKSVMVEQLVGDLEVDSSHIQEVLGWKPIYTMEQAMRSLSENKQ